MQQSPIIYNFISVCGLVFICLLAWASGRFRPIAWKTIALGLALQLVMGLIIFMVPAGRMVLLWVNGIWVALMDSAQAGIHFLFGPLALGPGQTGAGGVKSLGFILAIQALPILVFFMALTALAYQAGLLQRVVRLFSRLFVRTLGTSGAESLGLASSIFVGVETAGMVRPFLAGMTRSELFCILTACMSTVSSTVLGAYSMMLQPVFPTIAGHLVSASLISAPAAVVAAKLMMPEDGQPETAGQTVDISMGKYGGYMEAVIAGSNDGIKLLMGIIALLLSFLGLVALGNHLLGWAGGLLGVGGITIEGLLTFPAYPLALAMGIPMSDAWQAARLLGERVVLTEFAAYMDLAKLTAASGLAHARSMVIVSYALCGFAHVGSVAIFVGGFGTLVPGRMAELSRLGFKAMWAATLATMMTGCVAGIFSWGGLGLLGLAH